MGEHGICFLYRSSGGNDKSGSTQILGDVVFFLSQTCTTIVETNNVNTILSVNLAIAWKLLQQVEQPGKKTNLSPNSDPNPNETFLRGLY